MSIHVDFHLVLIFSIVNVVIDIFSSLAMNAPAPWLEYETAMTIYVASMPMLAASSTVPASPSGTAASG